MYKITVKGTARPTFMFFETRETIPVSGIELNGIEYDGEDFSSYINDMELKLMGVKNGTMRFEYKDGELWTITEYTSIRQLSNKKLEELLEFTTGQWSDGIGEGYEQQCCLETKAGEYFISPWHDGQKAIISQKKIS